jgi:hypothetical protein
VKTFITASFAAIVILLAPVASVGQSDERSLPTIDSESAANAESSAVVALEKLVTENRRLREELADARKSAATSFAEAEVFRRQVKEMTDRMEALGASTVNPSALEQRVLQAANTLRFSEANRQELNKALVRLATVASEFAKRPDHEAKLVMEAELKRTDEILAKAVGGELLDASAKGAESGTDLMNGKVSAVKPEIGCIVINLGSKQGVKVGMPFKVTRGDKLIGTVRVVDARQGFSGTVIQNLASEKELIRLGDTVKVEALN